MRAFVRCRRIRLQRYDSIESIESRIVGAGCNRLNESKRMLERYVVANVHGASIHQPRQAEVCAGVRYGWGILGRIAKAARLRIELS